MLTDFLHTVQTAMPDINPVTLLLASAGVYFVAGVIKGTLGIGFPTAAVSLLAQVTDARTAILLVIMPMLCTNLWQVIRSHQLFSVIRRLRLLLLTMLLFIAIFSQLASMVRVELLTAVLGLVVCIYALHSLYMKVMVLNPKFDRQAQLLAGVSAGIMGGLVSVWAPPILMYLNAQRLSKEQFIASSGVILLLGSCVLLVSYAGGGMLSGGLLLISSLLVLPSLIGFTVGEYARQHLSAERFERLLLWFFFIMGLNLIRRAIF